MSWEAWVAVYGAILSSVLAFVTIRESRRVLKVLCSVGMESSLIGGGPGYKVIEVACVNVGHRPIEIRNVVLLTTTGLELEIARNVYRGGSLHHLPEVIQDGESVVAKFALEEVGRYLRALNAAAKPPDPVGLAAAQVTDAEGKKRRASLPVAVDGDLARLVKSE